MRSTCRWLALVISILTIPSIVLAEGSGGEGGAAGERANWPCEGCNIVAPPGYDSQTPTPLLVTLHGDEGDPDYIQWRMEDETMSSGYLMLNLMCPRDLGCGQYDGSWWRWEAYSDRHDGDWVDRQIDAVEAQYNVELQRVYLAGFSGGASYLSEYPWHKSMRFAGLAYLGGGYDPARHGFSCEDSVCRIPAIFVIGSRDFLLDGANRLSSYLNECGHEVEFNEFPGLDHQIVSDGLPRLFDWMDERPHLCREEPNPVEPELGESLSGCTEAPDCGTCADCLSLCTCEGRGQAICEEACSEGGGDVLPPATADDEVAPPDGMDPVEFVDEIPATAPRATCSALPLSGGPSALSLWVLAALVVVGRRSWRGLQALPG